MEGFNLNKIDDQLKVSLNFYQTNQENEDNKLIPTVLPNFKYFSGSQHKYGSNSNYTLEFYNIFREKSSLVHAKKQQKLSHKYNFNKNLINRNSKINIDFELYNQFFNTEKKLIGEKHTTGTYYRIFPILGISSESPFRFKKYKPNLIFKPTISFIMSPGISNSNKLSNEDSTNNDLTLQNIYRLNRYSGTDKMDNSKRIVYGISAYSNNFKSSLSQTYEISENSNFHKEQGNDDNLSDMLGAIELNNNENTNQLTYNFRYNFKDSYLKKQNIILNSLSKYGDLNISYLDQNSKNNDLITKDIETINYEFYSKKITKFSKIKINGLYDLKKEINKEYSIGYSYFDECFGINIDFNRKSYEEENLKPQDILTLMFSFKNIGSYKSSNLAVSENDKQDIEWENYKVNNENFEFN